ncbi:MAG TPA: hypothetical protein VLD37_00345 [Candidatus Bilamarchaeum sp.]|nr:hypothetical protein [Candidatus Bilamarchaeum sp.]
MAGISDEFMRAKSAEARDYCLVILRKTAKRDEPGADKIAWEHGRRNFELRAGGVLSIVCPVWDGSDIAGIGIFNGSIEEIRKVMDGDPGVSAGIFTYEIHGCKGFPGDRLP